MSTKTARIATPLPGFCDVCGHPFAPSEDVHEFVFTPLGGSVVAQYATCARCHQDGRQEGAVSAPPVRAQVNCPPRINLSNSTYQINGTVIDCTEEMGEFLARSVIKVRFPEEVAA
ncbi:MAG: hypothetical protein QM741_10920 [Rudaea sp.]|uniref:hypothetical protein n=1 Tax=Rudaea sp. TaxID=2136325 RepID=UPI0039E55B25